MKNFKGKNILKTFEEKSKRKTKKFFDLKINQKNSFETIKINYIFSFSKTISRKKMKNKKFETKKLKNF